MICKTNHENGLFASDPARAQRAVTLQTLSVCKAQDCGCSAWEDLSQHRAVPRCWCGLGFPLLSLSALSGHRIKKKDSSFCLFLIRDGF